MGPFNLFSYWHELVLVLKLKTMRAKQIEEEQKAARLKRPDLPHAYSHRNSASMQKQRTMHSHRRH